VGDLLRNQQLKQVSVRADRSTRWYAVHLFDRRTKKAMKRLKKLHKLNDHDRHRLRIAIKKLRYAIYFFESIFDGSANKALSCYKDNLQRLQESLGALNDIAVNQKLLTEFGTDSAEEGSRRMSFAAGAVMGSERGEITPLLNTAKRAARNLRRAKCFWI
jgi:triphosphatase